MPTTSPRATIDVMRLLTALSVTAMTLAICCCVLLGTAGWFAEGFGTLTDCTNNYSCSTQSCQPCAAAGRWINLGGIAQWLLAAVGVVLLVRGVRNPRVAQLTISAGVILFASAITALGTGWRASESYCQPGTADYSSSYCATDS